MENFPEIRERRVERAYSRPFYRRSSDLKPYRKKVHTRRTRRPVSHMKMPSCVVGVEKGLKLETKT
jgi:hypothetical protein